MACHNHVFCPLQTTLTGPASVPPTTVCEVLKRVARRFPSKPALRVKRGGEWITWTWKEYYTDIAYAAKSMIRVGVEPFRGVCVLGFNSPEWFISYLGGIMASCFFFVNKYRTIKSFAQPPYSPFRITLQSSTSECCVLILII